MVPPVIVSWPCLRFIDTPSVHQENQPKPVSKENPIHGPKPQASAEIIKQPPIVTSGNSSNQDSSLKQTQTQPKTFAQALSNLCDIPNSQLPQPVLKGDDFSITIPEEEYIAGMDSCKYNLHARVIWPKGSTPLTAIALRNKLSQIWKNLSKWGVTSIGKGFYEFSFTCLEDVKRVRSNTSWNLNPGVLKLFAWTRDFSPRSQNNTSAQVWIRIHGLSQEYWRPKILFAIANSVGTPICTDSASTKPLVDRTFGHFARVLVDMDLTQQMHYRVLVERKDFAFFVEIEYENIPSYCSHCLKIGHYVDDCKFLNRNKEALNAKAPIEEGRKEFRIANDGRKKQGNIVTDPIVVEDVAEKSKNVTDENNRAKTSKSHDKTLDRVVVQNNRFEALVHQELVTYKEQDAELEMEINADIQNNGTTVAEEISSSHDTEFVDNTQQSPLLNRNTNVDQLEVHGPILHRIDNVEQLEGNLDEVQLNKDRLMEIEKKNKEFLEHSWANIAADEEAEQNLLQHLEKDPQDGFQVVVRGKSVKKKVPTKSSYATRHKTGNPKPFK
jgi:hypothetical protein